MRKEALKFQSLGELIKGTLFLPDPQDKEDEGLLPVIILCHGAIDYKEHFYNFAAFLANSGYAALALDMHGHGESGGERFNVKMAEWVPDIHGAIKLLSTRDDIDKHRIGAIGFSSGGTAILEYS